MKYIPETETEEPWSIESRLINWMVDHYPPPKTILELGSGDGTDNLMKVGYITLSIEHNPEYVKKCNGLYRYVPLKNGWYDPAILAESLVGAKYDLLLIDGPDTYQRPQMIDYLYLFNTDVPIIIDDAGHPPTLVLANGIKKAIGREFITLPGIHKVCFLFEGKI